MVKPGAYYPHDDEEQAYLRWLEAPGEDLGMFLGDGESLEARVAKHATKTPLVIKSEKPYGHVAYTRRSKSGKLVQVKAKGVKPVAQPSRRGRAIKETDEPEVKRNPEFKDAYEFRAFRWKSKSKKNPFSKRDNKLAHNVWNALREHEKTQQGGLYEDAFAVVKRVMEEDGWDGDWNEMVWSVLKYFTDEGTIVPYYKPREVVGFNLEKLSTTINKYPVSMKDKLVHKSIYGATWKTVAKACKIEGNDQQVIRDQFRAIVRKHGAQPRDGSFTAGAKYEVRKMPVGVQAIHMFTGEIAVAPHVQKAMQEFFAARVQDKDARPSSDQWNAIRCVLHETLHGCSPSYLDPGVYSTPRGCQLEEVTTEVCARYITSTEFGDAIGWISSATAGIGSYGSWVRHAVAQIRDVMKVDSEQAARYLYAGSIAVKADKEASPHDRDHSETGRTKKVEHATDIFLDAFTSDPEKRRQLKARLWTASYKRATTGTFRPA